MATPVSGADTWLTLNGVPLRFREGDEHLDAQAIEYKKNYFEITRQAPYPLEIFIDQEPLETRIPGYWQWRPTTYAGLYEIRVRASGYADRYAMVRVSPQYFTQRLYRKMQDDLSNIAADLLFRLRSPSHEYVEGVKRFQETSLLQEYKKIKSIIRNLQEILEYIRRNPYTVLVCRQEECLWYKLDQISGEYQAIGGEYITLQRRVANQPKQLYVPATWQVQQAILSYDTHENRLLKQFLRQHLVTKLTAIEKGASGEIQRLKPVLAFKQKNKFPDAKDVQDEINALQRVIQDSQFMKQRCWHWSSESFLKTVSENITTDKATQVLLKHPYYGRFYQLYLQFQQQFKLSLDTEHYLALLNMRKIPDLYEMWSVFWLTNLTINVLRKQGYVMTSSSLFYEIEKNYFQFDVRRNVANIMLEKHDVRVKVIYEPVYPNHAITRQAAIVSTIGRDLPLTPDMAIEVYQRGTPTSVIIFDAKYKSEKVGGGYYPLREDIDKMYRYAANIQYSQYDSTRRTFRPRKIVSSAFVLYPGNKVYTESGGSIGGLPLRPNMSEPHLNEVKDQLVDLLRDAKLI
jgi:hypothetical protein